MHACFILNSNESLVQLTMKSNISRHDLVHLFLPDKCDVLDCNHLIKNPIKWFAIRTFLPFLFFLLLLFLCRSLQIHFHSTSDSRGLVDLISFDSFSLKSQLNSSQCLSVCVPKSYRVEIWLKTEKPNNFLKVRSDHNCHREKSKRVDRN